MNRSLIRLLSCLVLVLFALSLVACGGREDPPTSAQPEVAAPTEAPPASDDAADPVTAQNTAVPTATPKPTNTTATEPTEAPAPTEKPEPTEEPLPETPQMEITLPAGHYHYTNGNVGRDGVAFDGKYWVASEGGVVAYNLDGTWRKYTTDDGLPHIATLAITVCPLPEPTLIAANSGGLVKFDPSQGLWVPDEKLNVQTTTRIFRMTCDAAVGRLVGYNGDIFIHDLNTGTTRTFNETNGLVQSYNTPQITVGPNGTVWVLYNGGGISAIATDGTITTYTQEAGTLPTNKVNDLAISPDGAVWIGSEAGLSHFNGASFTDTVDDENFAYFGPGQMIFTADGTLWMDYTSGICGWDTVAGQCKTVMDYRQNPAMVSGTGGIKGLSTDGEGGLYFYTSYDGSSAWDGTTWQKLVIPNEIPPIGPTAMYHDGEDVMIVSDGGVYRTSLYAATWERIPDLYGTDVVVAEDGWWFVSGSSLYFYDGDTVTVTRRGDIPGMLDQFINAIAIDTEGVMYFGQDKGYTIKEGDTYTSVTETDGWTMGNIRDLLATEEGIYAATTKGLVFLSPFGWEVVLDSTAGDLPNANIAALAQMPDGTLLLGTTEGLAYFDGETVTPDTNVGVSITDIAVSPQGDIWLTAYSTGSGFLAMGPATGDDGGIYQYGADGWEHWGLAEGAPGFSLRSVWIDGAGTVWAGGADSNEGTGIFRIVP